MSIRGFLISAEHFSTLLIYLPNVVVSLVLARLDYGTSLLAGLPVYLVRLLQSVLNPAT